MGKSRFCQCLSEYCVSLNLVILQSSGSDTEMDAPFHLWKSLLTQLFYLEVSPEDMAVAPIRVGRMSNDSKIVILKGLIPEGSPPPTPLSHLVSPCSPPLAQGKTSSSTPCSPR